MKVLIKLLWIELDMFYCDYLSSVNCACISDDATLLSAGFEDSCVRVWSLTPKRLRSLKAPSDLNKIDKEAGKM